MLSKQQPKKLSRGESSTYPTEFSDQGNFNPPRVEGVVPNASHLQAARKIVAFAEDIGVPPAGITILGGNPYVNKVGLLFKAHQAGIHSITSENIRNAHDGEKMVAGYHARVEMKDGSFFEGEGWASPMSINMKTLHNPDFINMTAETRAKNRQLRDAVGCGYVSAEETELISGIDTGTDIPAQVTGLIKPKPFQPKPFQHGEASEPKAFGVGEASERSKKSAPKAKEESIIDNTSPPEESAEQAQPTQQPQAGLVSPPITNAEVNFEQPSTINHQQSTPKHPSRKKHSSNIRRNASNLLMNQR